ncbi:uncharacterized protein [Apostichopus japonicus]|uniref:uncharacterized protein n=1 Tax=Stichopus japonicus TaxID=307972 RepID=UPI003AB42188
MGGDKWVLETITQGYRRVHLLPTLRDGGRLTPTPTDPVQEAALEGEISALLAKRAIVEVSREAGPLFRSSLFLTQKRDGPWRPILNLKLLNKNYIEPKRFMETLNLILPLLRKGMWAASVDAYLHIPIHRHHQRYLAFQYAGRKFTFRSHSGHKSFHKSGGNGNLPPQKKRSDVIRLPPRLAHSRRVEVQHVRQHTKDGTNPSGTGLDNQRNKITAGTNTDDPVPGGHTRFHYRDSQALRTKDRGSQNDHSLNHIITRVTQRNVAPSPGADGQSGRRGEIMQTTHAPAATPPAKDGQPTDPGQDGADPPVGRNHTSSAMVARHRKLGPRGPLHHQPATNIGHDGRLTDRVGSPLEQPNSLGTWSSVEKSWHINSLEMLAVKRALESFHGNLLNTATTVFTDNTTVVAYINRQGRTHSERLCQLAWEVLMTARDSGMTLRASHIAGKTKCDGRCPVQRTDGPQRVGTVSRNMQQDLQSPRQTDGGPVCDGGERQTSYILLQAIPPQGAPHRRHVLPMDDLEAYAFPPLCMIGQVRS